MLEGFRGRARYVCVFSVSAPESRELKGVSRNLQYGRARIKAFRLVPVVMLSSRLSTNLR